MIQFQSQMDYLDISTRSSCSFASCTVKKNILLPGLSFSEKRIWPSVENKSPDNMGVSNGLL